VIGVDASAMVDVLLRGAGAERIRDRLFDPNQSLHAPHLLDLEVTQVVRRYAAMGEIDEARGEAAIEDLLAFPVRRYLHDLFLMRVWAPRTNLKAFDAAYIALAEALDAELVTRDRRLEAAARSLARVTLV
jgi:predicted nucleic acid-binding protein